MPSFKVISPKFCTKFLLPPTYPLRPVIPNNACTPCITAAAGTELAGTSYYEYFHNNPRRKYFTTKCFHRTQILTGSNFRPLPNIPHCWPGFKELEPFFSSDVAENTPIPATDHQLGKPLPHQLLNPTIAVLLANLSFF